MQGYETWSAFEYVNIGHIYASSIVSTQKTSTYITVTVICTVFHQYFLPILMILKTQALSIVYKELKTLKSSGFYMYHLL